MDIYTYMVDNVSGNMRQFADPGEAPGPRILVPPRVIVRTEYDSVQRSNQHRMNENTTTSCCESDNDHQRNSRTMEQHQHHTVQFVHSAPPPTEFRGIDES